MTTLIVGISARAAAESAARSGHAVRALDAFGDIDLRRTCQSYSLREFPDTDRREPSTTVRLFRASLQLDFDEVVYGSGFENHPECVREWERAGKTVLGNDPGTLGEIRDWRRFFDFLESMHIPHPETRYVRNLPDFDFEEVDPADFLVKPVKSGGGHAVRRLDALLSRDDWPGVYEKPVLIQRRLEGILASISFVSGPGVFQPTSTTLQLVGNNFSPYRYAGNIAPLVEDGAIPRGMERAARVIAERYGLVGSNGVDFVISEGRPHVLEVNPRLQGSLEVVEMASGAGVFDNHIRACRGEELAKGGRPEAGFCGRRVVFAPRDGTVPRLTDLGFCKDVSDTGTTVREGAPLCTVLAQSGTSIRCLCGLREREKRVISRFSRPS